MNVHICITDKMILALKTKLSNVSYMVVFSCERGQKLNKIMYLENYDKFCQHKFKILPTIQTLELPEAPQSDKFNGSMVCMVVQTLYFGLKEKKLHTGHTDSLFLCRY